jgi:hypothetical protein
MGMLATLRLLLANDHNLLKSVFIDPTISWCILLGGFYGACRAVWDAGKVARRAWDAGWRVVKENPTRNFTPR